MIHAVDLRANLLIAALARPDHCPIVAETLSAIKHLSINSDFSKACSHSYSHCVQRIFFHSIICEITYN